MNVPGITVTPEVSTPARLQRSPVLGEVLAGGGHQERPVAEQGQGVGDVAGHAAPQPAHVVHQEAHRQPVHPVLERRCSRNRPGKVIR